MNWKLDALNEFVLGLWLLCDENVASLAEIGVQLMLRISICCID